MAKKPKAAATTAAAQREFLPWVEAARTMLMAGVVLVHCDILAAPGAMNWWPFGAWSIAFLSIMVPSFFLISGFVFSLGDLPSPSFDWRRFVKRRVVTLIVPFLAWNAIMIGLDLGLDYSIILPRDEPGVAWQAVLRFFTGYWQLYFVCALLQCIALLVLLRRFLAGRRLIVLVVLSGVVTAAFYGASSYFFWTRSTVDSFFEVYLDRLFAPWVFYFFLGVWLAQRPRARAFVGRFWWAFAALSVLGFQAYLHELRAEEAWTPQTPVLQFLASGFLNQPLGALAYFGFFQWLGTKRAADKPIAAIATLAPLSLGVYLCHNAILIPIHTAWVEHAPQHTEPWLIVPVLWVTVALLALLLTIVGRRLGFPGRILFAYRAPGPGPQSAGP